MTEPPWETAPSSPEWTPQADQAEPETENLQSSSQKSCLQKKITKGSSKEFLQKAKKANKLNTTVNLSEYLMETNKRSPLAKISPGHRTGEICLEEISTEFTNVASVHSYEVNLNKTARYCFKKLEDGAFSIEKKPSSVEQKNLEPSQTESTNKRKSKTISPYAGRYAYKPLKICFKKRSKKFKKSSEGKEHQADYVTLKQTNHLDLETELQSSAATKPSQKADGACHSQSSEGTWAAIKSLVMPRKRLHSFSKSQSYFDSRVPLEAKAGNAGIQRFTGKKTSTKLNIPCIRFSRHKKNSGPFEETDEEYYTVNRKEIKGIMSEPEANQDETALMKKCNIHQTLTGASLDKKVHPIAEQVRNAIHATERNAEKLDAGNNKQVCDNSQSEITEPETPAGILNGKHTQKNPRESRELNRGDSEAQTFSLNRLSGKDPASNVFLSMPGLGGTEKNSASEEEEMCTSQFKSQKARPDLHSCSSEQRKLENDAAERVVMSKDIEICTQSDNKQGLISPEHKAQSNEASDNTGTDNFPLHTGSVTMLKHGAGCESELYSGKVLPTGQPTYHSFTTSDQYELLLIKAASSLVKSVIQSSVQQVTDEMSFDSSQQPSILHS